MKRKVVTIISIIVALVLVVPHMISIGANENTASTENSSLVQETDEISDPDGIQEAQEGYVLKGQSNDLKLFFNEQSVEFYVQDTKNGFQWHSNPTKRLEDKLAAGIFKMEMSSLMVVRYINILTGENSRFNTYTGCVMDQNFKVSDIKNGFRIEFYFQEYKVKIPMEISIENNMLKAEVLTDKIIIENPDLFIYSVSLLPYFGAGQTDENGYVFVPDGSGGIIHFNNGKYTSQGYSRPIYGMEPTEMPAAYDLNVENTAIKMPVFGMKRNENAFLAIIDEGAELGYISAYTNKQLTSYSNVFSEFILKSQMNYSLGAQAAPVYEKGPITIPKLSVKYSFLCGDQADYSGMARVYKKYLIDTLQIKPENEKAAFFVSLYGGVLKTKSRFGVMVDTVVPLTTTGEVQKIVSRMKEAGIDNIVVNYNHWNNDELYGRMLSSGKISGNLNDKKFDIRKLISDKNFRFYPTIHGELHFYKGKSFFSQFVDAICDVSGVSIRFKEFSPSLGQGIGKPYYLLTTEKIGKHVERLLSSFSKSGYRSLGISDLGSVLYNDYRQGSAKRGETKGILEDALKQLDEKTDYVLLENPNIYAIKYCSDIINAPITSSGHDLIDEDVPFYSIALSGLARFSSAPLNGNNIGDNGFLKLLETGSMINYSWIYRDTTLLKNTNMSYLYSADYKYWLNTAAEQYKVIEKIGRLAENSAIYSHERVSEGVYATTYENQLKVYVNYGQRDYFLETGEAVKAGSYLLMKEGDSIG